MRLITHLLLIASAIFLCFEAYGQPKPIKFAAVDITIYFCLQSIAFILINAEWWKRIDLREKVKAPPEKMAQLLNTKLFSPYPYLFSIQSSSSIYLSGTRLTKLYSIRNKSFAEFFTAYFDESLITILIFLILGIPLFFLDQVPPSFLSFVNKNWIAFSIFNWLLSTTWFVSVSLLNFKIRSNYFIRKYL